MEISLLTLYLPHCSICSFQVGEGKKDSDVSGFLAMS